MKGSWIFLIALALPGLVHAQTQVGAAAFFQALQATPELEAARAAVRAAEANVAQALNPATVDAGFSTLAPSSAPGNFSDTRFNVGVTAYPFAYGERGDTARLRELELAQARLNLRRVQAQVEATALESAADVQMSRQALEFARTAAKAAEASYNVTELQRRRGAATAQQVRDANVGLQGTQNLLLSAQDGLEFAEATLTSLVGDVRPGSLPPLTLPEGTPTTLEDAQRTVEAARIGRGGAIRPFLPVARLDYSFDNDDRNRVSASIDSSTFAPRLGYSYDNDGYGQGGNLTLSLSATIAPDQFSNITRLDETLRAAEASRRATERDATLGESQLRNTWAEADRSKRLAELVLQNAQRTLAEVRRRESLGVASATETQTAAIALAQAGLDLRDSSRDQIAALLDIYEFYGLPPSERIPELMAAPRLEKEQ